MNFKRMLSLGATLVAATALTLASGAGGTPVRGTAKIDFQTKAGVLKYLRSIHVDPNGVVIQRGARNYAGPHCPGKGWTCTRSQRVVQIATARSASSRSFSATSSTNVAKCLRVVGSNQSCVIVQSAGNGVSNVAQVDQLMGQLGQTLQGTQQAQVTQTSTNGANSVQLNQAIGQLAATLNQNVNQSLNSGQTFSISQTSLTGAQSIKVNQVLAQLETAKSTSSGTQLANGTLEGHVAQSSLGVSTAKVTQAHSPTLTAGPGVDQTVIDPMKCCATQSGNPGNTLDLAQNGTVKTTGDATPNISAIYEADCQSSGNCTVTETQNTNGATSTNTQSGSTVSTTFNCTGTACTQGEIVFDGSPGTGAPPATLGGYSMVPFGLDNQSFGAVSSVIDPAGTIGLSPALNHERVGQGWATWSNGYTGDVYDTTSAAVPTQATITLPPGTKAFYFYAEPQQFAVFSVEATAQDGTTSGPINVQGQAGAQYFGFYGTGGATLSSITVTTADPTGFAIGEFGIDGVVIG